MKIPLPIMGGVFLFSILRKLIIGKTKSFIHGKEIAYVDPSSGTPYTRDQIWKAATAALYGLGPDSVPDDGFANLGAFRYGVGNEYVWAKQTQKYTVSLGQQKTYDSISTSTSVQYSDEVNVSASGVTLKSPSTSTLSSIGVSLIGKYAKISVGSISGKILYITDVSVGSVVDIWYKETSSVLSDVTVGYVNSPDPSAYPPSISDGYTYTSMGRLGEKVKLVTGSYIGTGTYGPDNPNSLTFNFIPDLWGIIGTKYEEKQLITTRVSIFPWGVGSKLIFTNASSGHQDSVTYQGQNVTWNCTNASDQQNLSGYTYYYFAIKYKRKDSLYINPVIQSSHYPFH